MRWIRLGLLAAFALCAAGCVSTLLAQKIVAPPNKSGIKALFSEWDVVKHAPEAFADQWKVTVPAPRADIAVASIEPADYQFHWDMRLSYPEGKPPNIDFFEAHWLSAKEAKPFDGAPKGTIVLLHGYLQNKSYAVPWAIELAQQGYRCVVVDLRGHGASTGKHIGFGAFEARDISAVIDDLGRGGWDVSRVGLLGMARRWRC